MSSLPFCCTPSPGAELAEILYCRYNAAGPAERAGLAWNGVPCPTWEDLVANAAAGQAGAAGVVAKWRTIAEYMSTIMVSMNLWAANPTLKVDLPSDGMDLLQPVSLRDTFLRALTLRDPELAELLVLDLPDKQLTTLGKYFCGWGCRFPGSPNNLGTLYVVKAKP